MTYALSVKSFSCWSCDHFRPISIEDSVQGYCRKNAPCALDLYGAVSEDLLTTKGDLLTRDAVQLVRQPVGVNESFLLANSGLTNGLEWRNILTTEGDLMTRTTGIVRLPIGSDDQVLTVDPTLTGKMAWQYPAHMFSYMAGFWGSPAVAGGSLCLTRLGPIGATTAPNAGGDDIDISHSTAGQYFDNKFTLPFMTAVSGKIVAVQVAFSAAAVAAAAVGPAPFLRLAFYLIDGQTELFRGNIDVPIPVFRVATLDNVAVDNFYTFFYLIPLPGPAVSTFWGWRVDLGAGGAEDQQIHQIRNVFTTVYFLADGSQFVYIPPALKSASVEGENLQGEDLQGKELEGENLQGEDLQGKELEGEDLEGEDLEIPFQGNMNPNLLSTAESLQKWCPILVAPNEWCGDYKPASHTVPAIPPFVYPTPPLP